MTTLIKPALHTLWQALLAGLATWFVSVDVGSVHGVSDVKRLALSAITAGGAAVLSAAYHGARQFGPGLIAAALHGRIDKAELARIADVLDGEPVEAPAALSVAVRDPYASPGPVGS